jgi:phosphatidylglycerol:prolipoprotein diacylglycerol transferase
MAPFLDIGPWQIRSPAILYALAVLIAGAFYLRRLTRRRFQPGPTGRALVWIVLAGAAGANLGGIVSLGYELLTGEIFPAPLKSVSMPGAILGGAVAAWLICRHYRLDFWWACDQAVPALPLGQAIGQFGCLARGCCFGAPAESWLALYLPDIYGDWALRYPTHLISAAALFAIFGLLLVVAGNQGNKETGKQGNRETRKQGGDETREQVLASDAATQFTRHQPGVEASVGSIVNGRNRLKPRFRVSRAEPRPLPAGTISLLYLALYLSFRLGVDFIRGDALPPWIGPLNTTQVACAAGLGLVAVAAARQWLRARRRS